MNSRKKQGLVYVLNASVQIQTHHPSVPRLVKKHLKSSQHLPDQNPTHWKSSVRRSFGIRKVTISMTRVSTVKQILVLDLVISYLIIVILDQVIHQATDSLRTKWTKVQQPSKSKVIEKKLLNQFKKQAKLSYQF